MNTNKIVLKVAVSRDFWHFFLWNKPTWAPDKQANMVLLKDSYHKDICEISGSAQANTVRSQTLRSLALLGVTLPAGKQFAESDSAQANTARSKIFYLT